jgi:myo-inositol-1(or 4)-monophosphatase
LISRKEHREGKWQHLQDAQLTVTPMGSIAYRLAQVAAHRAAATCTHGPRHEWDVAAGVALVHASRGTVQTMSGEKLQFNRRTPRVESLLAYSPLCDHTVPALLLGGTA